MKEDRKELDEATDEMETSRKRAREAVTEMDRLGHIRDEAAGDGIEATPYPADEATPDA